MTRWALALFLSLCLVPFAAAGPAWSGQDGVQKTTFTFPAGSIQLSGNAAFHAACPAPEPASAGPCVTVGPTGRAWVEYDIPGKGTDPGAGGDYWEINPRFATKSGSFCKVTTTTPWGSTFEKGGPYCAGRGSGDNRVGKIHSGHHKTEVRCENDIPNNGCRIVIYELSFEMAFWELIVDFATEESLTRLCVQASVRSYSDWYSHLHVDINWGDGTVESLDDGGRYWCHDYALTLVPYVVDVVLTDALGQSAAYHHVSSGGAPAPDPGAYCNVAGTPLDSFGLGDYTRGQCKWAADTFFHPDDPICGLEGRNLIVGSFNGIWFGGDCQWATSNPVGWGIAVAEDVESIPCRAWAFLCGFHS